MALLDFDTLVICNSNYKPFVLRNLMTYFSDCGIKKFIIIRFSDVYRQPKDEIIPKFKRFKKEISKIRIRGCKIHVYHGLFVHNGDLLTHFATRLKVYGSDLIFLKTPIYGDLSWINPELNHLVFKKKILPVFTSFERNLKTCPTDFANNLFKAHNAMFCVDLKFFLNPDYEHYIYRAITSETTVIPCITLHDGKYPNIVEKFEIFRQTVGDHAYFSLCKHIDRSCKRLWDHL